MAHGGHSTTSGSDPISDFLKNIFLNIRALPSNFVKFFFHDDDYDGLCVRCHGPVRDPTFQFCSETCAALHWDHVRQMTAQTSKQWICRYPTCTKPCYTENDSNKRYDYCGRKHAEQHKALMELEEVKRQMIREKRISHFDSSASYHAGVSRPWEFSSDNAPIRFYDKGALYYQFTNFYPAVIILDGLAWPTTEHYFQAQKFIGTPFVEIIRSSLSPRDAFQFSRQPAVAQWRRSDWEDVKINIMRKALLAKFSQHYDLQKLLLQTGTRALIEDSPYDSFWGIGGNGQGQNHLGKLLMEIRDEICKIRREGGSPESQVASSPDTQVCQATDLAAQVPYNTPPHCHQGIGNGMQVDPIPDPDPNFADATPSLISGTSTRDPNGATPSQVQSEPTTETGNPNLSVVRDVISNNDCSVLDSEEPDMHHQPSKDNSGKQANDVSSLGDFAQADLISNSTVELAKCLEDFVKELVDEMISNAVQRVVNGLNETDMEIDDGNQLESIPSPPMSHLVTTDSQVSSVKQETAESETEHMDCDLPSHVQAVEDMDT